MKYFQWFMNAIYFTIYVGIMSFGIYVLVTGFYYHEWVIEAFGVFVIMIGMLGLALNWKDEARRLLNE